MSNQQMPANAVFVALASALGCLISELQKKGAVDAGDVASIEHDLIGRERTPPTPAACVTGATFFPDRVMLA